MVSNFLTILVASSGSASVCHLSCSAQNLMQYSSLIKAEYNSTVSSQSRYYSLVS